MRNPFLKLPPPIPLNCHWNEEHYAFYHILDTKFETDLLKLGNLWCHTNPKNWAIIAGFKFSVFAKWFKKLKGLNI